jgi:hypothetical protein
VARVSFDTCGHGSPKEKIMKVSTNQTGNAIDQRTWETRDIRRTMATPITRSGFERRFCGVLIALIFAIVAIASVVLIHLSASLIPPDLPNIAFSDFL